ncbi:MAG: SGNH/GDSL hydrolase family protein [bacterium]|nr:SGNH/GDSL hydrolase family protein [bacterium]
MKAKLVFTILALPLFGATSLASPSSQPPAPQVSNTVLTTIGDSITWGGNASDRAKTSYGAVLAKALGARSWTNLGIIGESLIPEPNSFFLGHTSNDKRYSPMIGLLDAEVPRIPRTTTIVTIYIGTNDLWMAEQTLKPNLSNIATMRHTFDDVARDWRRDMHDLIDAVRTRAPRATIVVGTVINPADKGSITHLNFEPYLTYRLALTALVNSMNRSIVSQNVIVADLNCDPRLYDITNYTTPNDVHPTDRGHAAIAEDFLRAMNGESGKRDCAYEHVFASPAPLATPSASPSPS